MSGNSLILKNNFLTIEIDKPGTVYCGARFDWTGFIRQITFKNKTTFCATETGNTKNIHKIGAGLCNEFGITLPIGYDNCPVGQQFPKIGVGLLTRESNENYSFIKQYPILPAKIEYFQKSNEIVSFTSQTEINRGYAYRLEKTLLIVDNCLTIKYSLLNFGTETIETNEYCHNFLSFNNSKINPDVELQLSFPTDQKSFGDAVNPDGAVIIGQNNFNFSKTPANYFFFSNIGIPGKARYNWRLTNKKYKIFVEESVIPIPQTMNLWGAAHVISPEMFVKIQVKPGETFYWQREFRYSQIH